MSYTNIGDEHKNTQKLMISILASMLNGTEMPTSAKEDLTTDSVSAVYRLAKKHSLGHVISAFVHQSGVTIDPELLAAFEKNELRSAYKLEQMEYSFSEICSAFDEIGIEYIPLKGAVLRPHYPSEYMRTSCDIDILIHEYDLDAAISKLGELEYRCDKRNYHDISFWSITNVHLELHFSVKENLNTLDSVLEKAWEYALPVEKYKHAFSDDFFVFQIYAHMSYHFISGGCGIRSLMDLWIMENKMGLSYLCAKDLLEKAGIYQFAVEMSNLSAICFSGKPSNDFSDMLLNYLFHGGIYGNAQTHIAMKKSESGNTFGYALKRFFMPYKSMSVLFPILKKLPFLLPFCWAARGVNTIFKGKSKKIALELTRANNISNAQLSQIKEIRSRLGI